MELILDIDVIITDCFEVTGCAGKVTMLLFTGRAHGNYFNGRILDGGVDTQKTNADGLCRLSARYMLEGKDCEGTHCHVFIENNSDENGGLTPKIITDSKALSYFETAELTADINQTNDGVNIKIFLL